MFKITKRDVVTHIYKKIYKKKNLCEFGGPMNKFSLSVFKHLFEPHEIIKGLIVDDPEAFSNAQAAKRAKNIRLQTEKSPLDITNLLQGI